MNQLEVSAINNKVRETIWRFSSGLFFQMDLADEDYEEEETYDFY